ncbi:hypothetical protein DFQ04_1609 [Algoriphagus boseongensis]|uniref:Uncharacterized protein n=1 Tax=Algoriphagus boseongensis TaxID=1442587 RepID=A0A4R6T3G2_9BACT|nr:hypothetical protein [Algoriphagus boseongensis]TDQ16961.1 hypothetical protein DFQ04_1609 [Algoriphagus boseongensis]
MDTEKHKDLTWLEHLQRNSWEPEVIISGITLAVLFIIPSRLFDFSVVLIQDYGLEQIPAQLILVYFSLIITVFKIFLVIHLIMRFIWAGMLGITYAFPEGVIKEKLFKYSQSVDYPHPNVYLIKLERWCSMLYGFPITVAVPIFTITVYLMALIGIYLVFNLDFQVVYVIFMLSIILLALISFVGKTSNLKDNIGKSMSGTIGAVYQSNLGKWAFVSFSLVLIVISAPFISEDLKGFSAFQIQVNLNEKDFEWPNDQGYFEEFNSDKKRFARVWTTKKRVEKEKIEIYLPLYVREQNSISKINNLLPHDSISWEKVDSYEDQFRIFLNDSLVSIADWRPVQAGHTGQAALMGQLPIDHLGSGIHEVRVEKLTYLSPFLGAGNDLRHRKKWARFEFIKD